MAAFLDGFEIDTRGRGTIDITPQVARVVRAARIQRGIANVFSQHTSCSLIITENADPDVRRDLETLARRWAPDGDAAYRHDTEGADDMAAHARSVLTCCSLAVPSTLVRSCSVPGRAFTCGNTGPSRIRGKSSSPYAADGCCSKVSVSRTPVVDSSTGGSTIGRSSDQTLACPVLKRRQR